MRRHENRSQCELKRELGRLAVLFSRQNDADQTSDFIVRRGPAERAITEREKDIINMLLPGQFGVESGQDGPQCFVSAWRPNGWCVTAKCEGNGVRWRV